MNDSPPPTWPPDGLVVRLNRYTSQVEGGTVLMGGVPTRVTRLSPGAAAAITGREVRVGDATSRRLVRYLLDAGLADPVAQSLPPMSLRDVTVVVPVRDRPRQLERLLASIPSEVGGVIVVDDFSADRDATARVAERHGARAVLLSANVGPAGARNAGLARVTTTFVAFVDSDVVVEPGAIETMLRHFADPVLAMVAPRVLGMQASEPGWITRYENARSSLDLGRDASSVRPFSPVTWVSSTCLLARVSAVGEGFDQTMRVGEDVDLVWRLVAAGSRVRFEPAAAVRHEHRTRLSVWLGRKAFYGTGASPLALRHPAEVAPVVLPPWGVAFLVLLGLQRRWSVTAAAVVAVAVTGRVASRLRNVQHPRRIAARLVGNGLAALSIQGTALLLRHWWPAAAVAAVFSRRMRRALVVSAVVDAAIEFLRLRPELDPVSFAVARRLDDIAYGAGMWWGSIRGRSVRALLPAVRRRRPSR